MIDLIFNDYIYLIANCNVQTITQGFAYHLISLKEIQKSLMVLIFIQLLSAC